jgi:hypothetical protein
MVPPTKRGPADLDFVAEGTYAGSAGLYISITTTPYQLSTALVSPRTAGLSWADDGFDDGGFDDGGFEEAGVGDGLDPLGLTSGRSTGRGSKRPPRRTSRCVGAAWERERGLASVRTAGREARVARRVAFSPFLDSIVEELRPEGRGEQLLGAASLV